ncbi:hypothetical protein OH720_30300 [Pseudomonas sp. WJP1]|uniref:hypothetical protein n=1 Tax=Pseudomonas sp. WJP1 TaxID=2986947 RepID=UPI00234AA871|nr:hypothetical protein [Pseudomonas sp. WJP1]WCM51175.1 hypothetical protein OH720_30300 [Pseudomonas sp. WJP1]
MKIALFLLVSLVLQETQANEATFVKTKEGCSTMLEVITFVDSVSWSGKCVDGLIEGVGIATYVKGNKKISFIEEYMGGVRAYPYIVDKSGAIRLGGGAEARYVTMAVCKKLDECTALYDYAVKSKRLASLDNRIGKDIEMFGRETTLYVIGGGKVVYTKHPQGRSLDFDYSGVKVSEPSPKNALSLGQNAEDAGTYDGTKYKPGTGCERNLSYLSSRLKKFSPAMINQIREAILATDMIGMMSTINQQGLSPQVAINQSLQQADAFDQTAAEALSTVEQVDAYGTTDEEFEMAIKSGKLSVTSCSGIHDSALCTAIVNKYGAIASRAVAANLMCFKRTNQWPL